MPRPNYARTERAALCDLFEQVGPDAPTLCEGWTTRDLAAHLVVRERRPDAALGIIAAPFANHGEKVRQDTARREWTWLVDAVRHGPPRWAPSRLGAVDQAMNTVEFFVHHEDVRRGGGDLTPRTLDAELEEQLWSIVRRMSKLMLRKAPAGVTLTLPSGSSVTPKAAEPRVEVIGPAGELVLFAYGRQRAAQVEYAGPEEAVEAVRTASFGV